VESFEVVMDVEVLIEIYGFLHLGGEFLVFMLIKLLKNLGIGKL
jgi:hypothetical protein